MRSIIPNRFVIGGAFLLCSAMTAHAMPSTLMKARVPFPFVVNGQTFPAGTYTVQRDMSSVLLIRGDRINQPTMFVSTVPDGGQDPAGSRPAFEFKRYENQYRLMTVWESGHEGWDIITR
jgi:hypothetical protein